jgi:hypothetical protein
MTEPRAVGRPRYASEIASAVAPSSIGKVTSRTRNPSPKVLTEVKSKAGGTVGSPKVRGSNKPISARPTRLRMDPGSHSSADSAKSRPKFLRYRRKVSSMRSATDIGRRVGALGTSAMTTASLTVATRRMVISGV